MLFSILVPTRGRTSHIEALMRSLDDKTINKKEVEILFCYDNDDIETKRKLDNIVCAGRYSNFYIRVFGRERSEYLNRDYYNYLAKMSTGKYVWAVGDDVRFLTKGWDEIVEREIERYLTDKPDRIAYIETEDGTDASHCCFPILTREAIQASGMFFHESIMTWGTDRTLNELYTGIGRTLTVEGVAIDHVSYHDGKNAFDETAKSVRDRFFKDPNCHNKVTANIIPKQIEYMKGLLRK